MSAPRDQPPIDWTELARSSGTLNELGREFGSSKMAREALERIIGPDVLVSAVDHYVAGAPGSELARSVLWLLHPWSAMQRCYEIYRNATDAEDRRSAVELLRVVADERALPWIQEFLNDSDQGVQAWGAGVVDQLLFSSFVDPAECGELLTCMQTHRNALVRETYIDITSHLDERNDPSTRA